MSESGYDKTLFVDQEAIQDFLCSICDEVLRNPVMSPNGSEFCHDCVMRAIAASEHGAFTVSGEILRASTLNVCKRTREIVNAFKIHCPTFYGSNPCNWIGTPADLEAHSHVCLMVELNCEFYPTDSCSFVGCTGKCLRRDIDSHQEGTVPKLLRTIRTLEDQLNAAAVLDQQRVSVIDALSLEKSVLQFELQKKAKSQIADTSETKTSGVANIKDEGGEKESVPIVIKIEPAPEQKWTVSDATHTALGHQRVSAPAVVGVQSDVSKSSGGPNSSDDDGSSDDSDGEEEDNSEPKSKKPRVEVVIPHFEWTDEMVRPNRHIQFHIILTCFCCFRILLCLRTLKHRVVNSLLLIILVVQSGISTSHQTSQESRANSAVCFCVTYCQHDCMKSGRKIRYYSCYYCILFYTHYYIFYTDTRVAITGGQIRWGEDQNPLGNYKPKVRCSQ